MTSIFVAKLDYGVSQDELKSVFERFGKVNKVTIAVDRETGKPRGFAFVEMFSEEEATQAIESLEGFKFNGRPISVKKADDRSSSNRPHGENKGASFTPRDSQASKPFKAYGEQAADYKKPDEDSKKPVSAPQFNDFPAEIKKKESKKKTKEKTKDLMDGRPKPQKMQAYKKSGKSNRFIDFDDEDDF